MTVQPWVKSFPPEVRSNAPLDLAPVQSVLDKAAERFGPRPALEFMGKRTSYAELGALANRAAAGFQKLGVRKGVHVGLFLPNTPHYIIAFFGILKAGGTVVNYSPLDAEKELAHKVEDSQTDIMVTIGLNAIYPQMGRMLGQTRLKKLVVGQLQEVLPFPKSLLFPLARRKDIAAVPNDDRQIAWRKLLDNDGKYTPVPIADPKDEVAVLQYTGGTTGVPKGAMLTHANLLAAQHQAKLWTEGDPPILEEGKEKVLAVLPLFHIYALTVIMLAGVRGGAEIILHPRFELAAVLRDLDRKKPTVFP